MIIEERAALIKKATRIFCIGLVLILIWAPLAMLFVPQEELAENMIHYVGAGALRHGQEIGVEAYIWITTIVLFLIHVMIFVAGCIDLRNPEESDPGDLFFKLRLGPALACLALGLPLIASAFTR